MNPFLAKKKQAIKRGGIVSRSREFNWSSDVSGDGYVSDDEGLSSDAAFLPSELENLTGERKDSAPLKKHRRDSEQGRKDEESKLHKTKILKSGVKSGEHDTAKDKTENNPAGRATIKNWHKGHAAPQPEIQDSDMDIRKMSLDELPSDSPQPPKGPGEEVVPPIPQQAPVEPPLPQQEDQNVLEFSVDCGYLHSGGECGQSVDTLSTGDEADRETVGDWEASDSVSGVTTVPRSYTNGVDAPGQYPHHYSKTQRRRSTNAALRRL